MSIEPLHPQEGRAHIYLSMSYLQHPSLLKNYPAPYIHWREGRTHIRGKGHWANQQRRQRSHRRRRSPLFTHPCPRIHAALTLTHRREGRAHICLDGLHSAGSTHPCSRTPSSNAFPAEEKTALTFCALSHTFRPNTLRAIPAQEFGQFSSGWEPTGRRARASSLRPPVPAQEFGQFLTANPTQRRCIDANGKTRRPNPTQEFGQFFEERRALHWRRHTRMDSSIHPCSRIRTVLGQGRPHLIGRRAGGCEHPSLLKNLDSSEWGRSYLGDRCTGCFQQPSLLKNSDGGPLLPGATASPG